MSDDAPIRNGPTRSDGEGAEHSPPPRDELDAALRAWHDEHTRRAAGLRARVLDAAMGQEPARPEPVVVVRRIGLLRWGGALAAVLAIATLGVLVTSALRGPTRTGSGGHSESTNAARVAGAIGESNFGANGSAVSGAAELADASDDVPLGQRVREVVDESLLKAHPEVLALAAELDREERGLDAGSMADADRVIPGPSESKEPEAAARGVLEKRSEEAKERTARDDTARDATARDERAMKKDAAAPVPPASKAAPAPAAPADQAPKHTATTPASTTPASTTQAANTQTTKTEGAKTGRDNAGQGHASQAGASGGGASAVDALSQQGLYTLNSNVNVLQGEGRRAQRSANLAQWVATQNQRNSLQNQNSAFTPTQIPLRVRVRVLDEAMTQQVLDAGATIVDTDAERRTIDVYAESWFMVHLANLGGVERVEPGTAQAGRPALPAAGVVSPPVQAPVGQAPAGQASSGQAPAKPAEKPPAQAPASPAPKP